MPLTSSQIQANIDELQAARDAGVLRIKHGNDEVIYQDPASMDKALQRLKGDLAASNGVKPRSRVGYVTQWSKNL
jgi:hypothetical protein